MRTSCILVVGVVIAIAGFLAVGCASDTSSGRIAHSPYPVEAIAPKIKPGMIVWDIEKIAETRPVLVHSGRFRWRMKNGSIFTDFDKSTGQWIVTNVDLKLDDDKP